MTKYRLFSIQTGVHHPLHSHLPLEQAMPSNEVILGEPFSPADSAEVALPSPHFGADSLRFLP